MRKILLFIVILFSSGLIAEGETSAVVTINEFHEAVSKEPAISRMNYFNSFVGSRVRGHGVVVTSKTANRYNSHYQISVRSLDTKSRITIICNLYSSNSLIQSGIVGKKLTFSGRLLLVTPVDSSRQTFILDILLDEAAIRIE
ncbi:MAG: hypothetical protein PF637_02550 [Spirochaetes bacterium]|nr:hypothetical protein [Spirochaetota bacterium]